jgi:hypothetical protein
MEPHFPQNQRVNIQQIDVAYHEDSKSSTKNKKKNNGFIPCMQHLFKV